MSLASPDSNRHFAQEQSLHQDHSWRSIRGEVGSPGQSCQGKVAPGLVMEVFSWPCVLVREAAVETFMCHAVGWRGEGERSGFPGAHVLCCACKAGEAVACQGW